MPFAPSGYQFYRNVMDYGATGDGTTDDTAAINRAVSDGNRCGKDCGSTSVLGALVYFPPGTYVVSTPIIQYYYTQFVGDPNDRPTIKGSANFTGIALIDTDPYIPGGNGDEWYINQNQFYRQIRNFVLDMTAMNWTNYDQGQEYVPTGIHWQVAQSTSLQNIYFNMPVSTASQTTTAVGVFMENGSGGFVSDLEFFGGNIGFRAGSQQYTARNLQFTSCLTGVSMIWDWGFTWKNINFDSVWVAFDCTSLGGLDGQGTGSITVLDSTFNSVPYPITLRNGGPYPDILLDNLYIQNSASVVLISGGETIFEGTPGELYVTSWAYGRRYTSLDGSGTSTYGMLDPAPQKPESLLDPDGEYFVQSRPQYESYAASDFIVATANGVANDATGDQTSAINTLLSSNVGSPIFFPAGIYLVQGTVYVPVGSIIVGEGWSQIMGTGSYFEDEVNPKVMVQVGAPGDSGIIQISDMLFTVKGPTAGAILMEWNVHESTQGSAAMWDSHFRVGGANGTELQVADCPKLTGSVNQNCMAASMLLHLTASSSGYFENVWAWVADHDLDAPVDSNSTTTTSTQINIYAGRGPTWFYGCASEHSILYQYQLSGAKDIYLGHIQTETPYFQDKPDAASPYTIGTFTNDPTFAECTSGSSCEEAWALRVLSSSDVFIYSAGFYSFFQQYSQACLANENCQEALVETSYTQGLWLYNLFTIGATEMISPAGGVISPTYQRDNQNGYSTELSAWLVLAEQGGNIGSSDNPQQDGSGVVYIDPIIFSEPNPTVQCYDPCTLVFPLSAMSVNSVISYAPIPTVVTGGGSTITTTLTPTPETVSVISFWSLPIPAGQTSFVFNMTTSFQPPPQVITVGGTGITITPEAQSTHYGSWDSTEPANTVLPTTVITSNGKTQTFSEDQFPSLTGLTTTTEVTTTLSANEVQTTTSTTTLIPVVFPVTIGGFYWSPVPEPTAPEFPIPALPDFPPIPSPPCFRLGDLFSIDCPPNDNKAPQTTHFTRGPNSPSCSSNCGHLPSETGSSSSSSCTTQTVTSCRTYTTTTPFATVCASYEGCECVTKTVTDYQVSCDLSSCTTTGSSVQTGCYVTESDSTTGEYCVTGVTVLSDDDQGQNGLGITVQTGSSSSLPGSVVIYGTPYTPTSGSVVVGGNTIAVPTVSSLTTITISGTPMVIVPGGNVIPASTTITTIITSGPGAIPGSWIAPSTAPSTTPTTSPTSTPGTAPSPSPTKAIFGYGVLDEINSGGEFPGIANFWAVVDGVDGPLPCDSFEENTLTMPGSDGIYSYPSSWVFISPVQGYTSCTYTNPSAPQAATGTLHCPDIPTPVLCPIATSTQSCVDSGNNLLTLEELFYCMLP
ncbi:hypothetical protein CDV55_106217 [Aspergillus turcosus]|uniref:Rhodanese domain-containing protein n=1 Tax=Aspergillus turcosus TaxID=1245748 RepID=A0A229YK78_9EURO|nr:hypothetical protein CDV55_106217 [Aspergillus turcosus]RLL99108.1 hypothetical protein CFD26_103476 [Aspergillus turcosus]